MSRIPHRVLVSQLLQPFNILPHGLEKTSNKVKKLEEFSSKSTRLMIDYGVVRQSSPGIFHYLPLMIRSLDKLTGIIDTEMASIGAQKCLLPNLTSGDLWKATGRWNQMGQELIKVKDRHEKDFVLSPTHEESITHLVASLQTSYKSLPLKLYQISNKFRDEMKPRFGIIRGKEFIMKDLYSFDKDLESAERTYDQVTEVYHRVFQRLQVPYYRVQGDTGDIGGSQSHEYHVPASIGQDTLLICPECDRGNNVEVCTEKHIKGTLTNLTFNS